MLAFYLYGFFIGIAILVSASISERFRKKISSLQLPVSSFQLVWWVVIPGIMGARLYHVLDYWEYYGKNLVKIFYVWEGGVGILGAIAGGILGVWIFAKIKYKKQKIKNTNLKIKKFSEFFFSLLDIIAVGLPAGQAIGRLGNFLNQELYGLPTDLPWGIYIRPENRAAGYEAFDRFHPLFAYEAAWCLIIFIIIITFIKVIKRRGKGELFFLYLGLYGLGRFFLEFLRIEKWTVFLPFLNWHLPVAQVISIIFIIVAFTNIRILSNIRIYKS